MSSREKILARRASFIAAAIAGAGALGCSSDTTSQVCLEPAIDGGRDTATTTDAGKDTAAEPCLSAPFDSGVEDTSGGSDTLEPADTNSTDPDTGPTPCLKMPLPEDAG